MRREGAAAPEPDEARQRDLLALHRWYHDWSATARGVITRRDYLIRLGLANAVSPKRRTTTPGGGTSPTPRR